MSGVENILVTVPPMAVIIIVNRIVMIMERGKMIERAMMRKMFLL